MLSLQDVGGTYKSHIGDYEVEVRCSRPTSNTGSVSVALEWAEGDFSKITRNDAVVFAANEREGDFVIARLGQVHLSKAKKGTQRWDGRIIAKSTVTGDNLKLDRIRLVPISEGAGEVTGAIFLQAFTTASARDEFDQTAGALATKVLPVGGTWAGAGSATDLAVEATGHTATRTASADSTTDDTLGRYALAGTATFTDCIVQVDQKYTLASAYNGWTVLGPLARYTDTNNWVQALFYDFGLGANPGFVIRVRKRVGGTGPAGARLRDRLAAQQGLLHAAAVRLVVGPLVRLALPQGSETGSPVIQGYDADIATGGALASGKVGIYDFAQTTP
jgi:hypothetical protein